MPDLTTRELLDKALGQQEALKGNVSYDTAVRALVGLTDKLLAVAILQEREIRALKSR